jgi:D-3-phosphoglycerate dehydrogenase
VVGIIGTILGDAGVNIAAMKLGRKEKGSTVLTLVSIDGDLSKEILEKIRSQKPILDASVISLTD